MKSVLNPWMPVLFAGSLLFLLAIRSFEKDEATVITGKSTRPVPAISEKSIGTAFSREETALTTGSVKDNSLSFKNILVFIP